MSRSTVSRVCEQIKTQFDAWCARRLHNLELDYLFLDGSHFKYHANAAAEPVLAAWGIDTAGKSVFIGLEAASSESGDAWEGFLTGLGERGLRCPLLVISDGAPGLIGAERCPPAARAARRARTVPTSPDSAPIRGVRRLLAIVLPDSAPGAGAGEADGRRCLGAEAGCPAAPLAAPAIGSLPALSD